MSQSKDPKTVDRISDLSDEILGHILSFLPTKDAFTTTFLSKRWNSLCYSLTTLCFEDVTMPYSPNEFNRFIRLIDTFMLSPRLKNQSLKTFRIKCRFEISDSQFYAWIEAAKQRRIEEFHCFIDNHSVILNPTFFISQTLLVLKLERLKFKYVNFCVDLPLLKTLNLMYIRFQYQNDFKKLLNACPNLQDLHTCYPFYMYPEKNNEAQEFKSLILSKLVRADIDSSSDVPLNAISNVEFLRLTRVQDPSLHMNLDDFFKRIPVFQNLVHVKLYICGFSQFWDGIVHFLQHCPKLQILYMNKWAIDSSEEWDCPISSPKRVSSHLRSCTIVNFESSKNDLRFATYILQNARRLEVMTIYVNASSSNGMQMNQIIEELSTCPRMVPGCKLSFLSY